MIETIDIFSSILYRGGQDERLQVAINICK